MNIFSTLLLLFILTIQWRLPEASGLGSGSAVRQVLMKPPTCGPKDGKTFNMLGPLPQKPLPLPQGANGVKLDRTTGGKVWGLKMLSGDIYFVTDGTYQSMFAIAGSGVIVFDSPPNLAFCMPTAIQGVTGKPVTHVFYSHSHKDHIDAATLFGDDVKYVASKRVADELKIRAATSRPVPDVTFSSKKVFTIRGLKIVAKDVPGVHDDGNVLYYLPQHKIAMFVDVVFPGWAPYKHFASASSMDKVEEGLKEMLAIPATTYVTGHLGRPGTRADVEDYLKLFYFLRRIMKQIFANPDNFPNALERVGDYASNQWLLFDAYEQIQIEQCYARLVQEWGSKLGGMDVFGRTLCWSMYKHVQLEVDL